MIRLQKDKSSRFIESGHIREGSLLVACNRRRCMAWLWQGLDQFVIYFSHAHVGSHAPDVLNAIRLGLFVSDGLFSSAGHFIELSFFQSDLAQITDPGGYNCLFVCLEKLPIWISSSSLSTNFLFSFAWKNPICCSGSSPSFPLPQFIIVILGLLCWIFPLSSDAHNTIPFCHWLSKK